MTRLYEALLMNLKPSTQTPVYSPIMMCIIVFPSFFTRPPKPLEETITLDLPPQAQKKVRRARFRALLHEQAPYFLGWTQFDSRKTKRETPEVIPPPYSQDEGDFHSMSENSIAVIPDAVFD